MPTEKDVSDKRVTLNLRTEPDEKAVTEEALIDQRIIMAASRCLPRVSYTIGSASCTKCLTLQHHANTCTVGTEKMNSAPESPHAALEGSCEQRPKCAL